MRKEDVCHRRAQIHNVAKISRNSRSLPRGIDGVNSLYLLTYPIDEEGDSLV
jgi:hypothetical protein